MAEMTHAALFDQLQEWFGVGDYDEITSRVPHYKARMNEIGKLKRQMNARKVDVATLHAAAEWAHIQHKPVTAVWELIEMIPEARKAARESARSGGLHEDLAVAVQEALDAGEQDWAERLAASPNRDVLDAWRSRG